MPKSPPRRNAAEGENHRFLKGITGKIGPYGRKSASCSAAADKRPIAGRRPLASKRKNPPKPQGNPQGLSGHASHLSTSVKRPPQGFRPATDFPRLPCPASCLP